MKNKKGLIIVFIILIISINIFPVFYKKISNYSLAVVMSDSMTPVLNKYDLIVIKKQKKYKEADIVAYYENKNIIVHRIISKGDNYVITKGDANKVDDNKIESAKLKGKVVRNFNDAGRIILLLQDRKIRIVLYVILILSIVFINRDFNKKR